MQHCCSHIYALVYLSHFRTPYISYLFVFFFLLFADSWSMWRRAGANALLLSLESRSGADHLRFLRRLTEFALARREGAGYGGSKGLGLNKPATTHLFISLPKINHIKTRIERILSMTRVTHYILVTYYDALLEKA